MVFLNLSPRELCDLKVFLQLSGFPSSVQATSWLCQDKLHLGICFGGFAGEIQIAWNQIQYNSPHIWVLVTCQALLWVLMLHPWTTYVQIPCIYEAHSSAEGKGDQQKGSQQWSQNKEGKMQACTDNRHSPLLPTLQPSRFLVWLFSFSTFRPMNQNPRRSTSEI